MFGTGKFRQIFVLSNVFAVPFVTVTTTLPALPATTNSDVVQTETRKPRMSVRLAANEKDSRSEPQGSVRLEELTVPRYDYPDSNQRVRLRDTRFDVYNQTVRLLQQLPSRGQSLEIKAEDSPVQRLLKQQLNDALAIHQIVGQFMDRKLENGAYFPPSLPAIQIAIAEMNRATSPNDQAFANEVCLRIAQKWERNELAFERAGLGTRSDTLKASYYRRHCEIQKIKLEKERLSSIAVKEPLTQQQRTVKLEEIKPFSLQGVPPIETLPVERREGAQRFRRVINPLIGYYNANIKLLKQIPGRQSLEIRTEGSHLQKLQKQQLNAAVELNRLQGSRLGAGLIDRTTREVTNNVVSDVMLPAIQIAITDIDLATSSKDRTVAIETGMKIAQAWENKAVFDEKDDLHKRMLTLTARYWKRYFEIQKTQPQSPL